MAPPLVGYFVRQELLGDAAPLPEGGRLGEVEEAVERLPVRALDEGGEEALVGESEAEEPLVVMDRVDHVRPDVVQTVRGVVPHRRREDHDLR
jgi:hypothetical protein